MRGIQRGITTTFIVFVILAGTIAITAVYLSYFQTQKQKASEINSFEACAKLYPVMESYPEQCQTPDGKHFTKIITETPKSTPDLKETDPNIFKSFDETYQFRLVKGSEINKKTGCGGPEITLNGSRVVICSYNYGSSPKAKSMADQKSKDGKVLNEEQVLISQVSGIKQITQENGFEVINLYFDFDKYQNNQPTTITIYYSGKNQLLLDQILSTFEFIK